MDHFLSTVKVIGLPSVLERAACRLIICNFVVC